MAAKDTIHNINNNKIYIQPHTHLSSNMKSKQEQYNVKIKNICTYKNYEIK